MTGAGYFQTLFYYRIIGFVDRNIFLYELNTTQWQMFHNIVHIHVKGS